MFIENPKLETYSVLSTQSFSLRTRFGLRFFGKTGYPRAQIYHLTRKDAPHVLHLKRHSYLLPYVSCKRPVTSFSHMRRLPR
jgi:hypothetical protein